MSPSLYDLLDVDRDASDAEIRAAWKAAIADLDPTDRRFRAYNQAAEVLLDPSSGRRTTPSSAGGDAAGGADAARPTTAGDHRRAVPGSGRSADRREAGAVPRRTAGRPAAPACLALAAGGAAGC